jgi:hypothetical protein
MVRLLVTSCLLLAVHAQETTLSNPKLTFTAATKPYAVLKRAGVEMVVVDNSKVADSLLPDHRAGYSGVASLKYRNGPNLFVPQYSGLNFEHILDGAIPPDRRAQFEPRASPMELRIISPYVVELHQPPSFLHGLESCQRYELLKDGTIQLTVEAVARQKSFRYGYINLFWASYIQQPESLDIHFPGPAGWLQGTTPEHGKLSTHAGFNDNRQFKHDEPYPLTLVHSMSKQRFIHPWYFGVSHGLAFAQMFRPGDNVRITQSPSGGGKGNPAWDFQYTIPDYEVNKIYRFVMRASYLPFQSADQVEKATRQHREALAH